MTAISKSQIDRAGNTIARDLYSDEIRYIESEDILDIFRRDHLTPLSETTIDLQNFLNEYGSQYYIAQRLKRKPQIIRKLKRLSVRLTQLQDIAGCRIIVQHNSDVEEIRNFLTDKIEKLDNFHIEKTTDYRPKGRDDTGYRALHMVIRRDHLFIELQIRSKIQHYWSESIERISVIYGHHLKEGEGDDKVITYFKKLSDAFYEIEMGREPSIDDRLDIDALRDEAEKIIIRSDKHRIFDSYVNEDIINTLVETEKGSAGLNNWILVFDWNEGNFVSWDIVGRNPVDVIASYVKYEQNFPFDQGYEVVLIGSSSIETVRETHSHYFGIEKYETILSNIESSIATFSRKIDIDVGARKILATMHRRHLWGKKTSSIDTLRNHFCKNVITFDSSFHTLLERGYIIQSAKSGGFSLNIRDKARIERYL